jgi:outer membrane receptor protein involved in Fe transport|tara:strand:+ start:5095 stop:7512 length:2418 start_codon:yes stop_codon:yes gene_type:complete
MKNYLLLTILSILFTNVTIAQEFTLTGVVLESETKEELEYAIVTVLSTDNIVVTDGLTNSKGKFSITVKKGEYNLMVEYISHKNFIQEGVNVASNLKLGNIELDIDAESLDEVEIIAENTTVDIRLDKKIYTVGRDLTVKGGSVSDVLDNVPSISVDVEGNVALRGSEDVRILINGKPSGLVGLNSAEALRQLPSESIEKVEVITSPSARYDAQGNGGIINIILRRNKLLGFNGTVNANIGDPKSSGISTNLNYRTGDVNIFNSSGLSDRLRVGDSYAYSEYYNGDDQSSFIRDNRNWERENNSLFTNTGLEWYIDDNTSITTSFLTSNSEGVNLNKNTTLELDSSQDVINETFRLENEISKDENYEYSLNFDKRFNDEGHKLVVDFQMGENTDNENSILTQNNLDFEQITSDETNDSKLIKADYVLPIGENRQFEAGFKIEESDLYQDYKVYSNLNNNLILDTEQSNVFQYKEQINAIYSQYGFKIDDKYSFLFGVRVEQTKKDIIQITTDELIKKDDTGVFPTFNFGLEISEDESVTFGYSRRLRRPWSRFINPFPSKNSPTSIFRGNPNLDPTYSNNFDLGYLKTFESSFSVNSSMYFQKSTNTFNFITQDTGETVNLGGTDVPIIERFPINLATNARFGFEFNLSYRPSKKWSVNSNFNLYNNKVEGEYNEIDYGSENLSWSMRLNNKLTLPGEIEWQTRMNYRGPREDAVNKTKASYSTDLAFSKDILNEKGTLSLNVRDLFDSSGRISEAFTETFYSESKYRWSSRSFTLNFTYRINQKKKRYQREGQSYQGGGDEYGG